MSGSASSNAASVRGRFAPSPTGALHLGNLRTALLAWLQARAEGGVFILRVEDLDRPRVLPGAAEALAAELRWVGLDWDEGPDVGGAHAPYLQSERMELYRGALARLERAGRLYPCYCSRAEVARIASAPHGPWDDGPRYPGTCRSLTAERRAELEAELARAGRAPCLRFRLAAAPGEEGGFTDGLQGACRFDLERELGDFPVWRADGLPSYQLATALDDALMGITHVLRGEDLLSSTPRQLQLIRALGLAEPTYLHVPLLSTATGERMAKRKGEGSISWYRERGASPGRLVAALARTFGARACRELGLSSPEAELTPRELLSRAGRSWREFACERASENLRMSSHHLQCLEPREGS